MATPAETRFAETADGHSIAYQVIGDGPIDVLVSRPTLFPVDLMWDEPHLVHFLDRLSSFCRHIWFDPLGTGASDHVEHGDARLIEVLTDNMRTVLDAAGVSRAVLLGLSVPSPLLFAAMHPERTTAAILFNASARFRRAHDYPEGWDEDVIGAARAPSARPGVAGVEQVAPSLADDSRFRRWFERAQRLTIAPSEAAWRMAATFEIDLRDVLALVQVPTLVLYRRDARVAVQSRYLADHIERAECADVPGADLLPFTSDPEPALERIERFLTGQFTPPPVDRVLATILFTDLVESTQRAEQLGDRRWRELLASHDAVVRDELGRFRGREVKFTGDGFLTTFDGPARAIRCACAIRDGLAALGLEVRAGVHTGEVERHGDDVTGIAVHIAQRVMTIADPGQVVVSRTVADLVAGSDIELRDLGEHALKGVSGPWRLFGVSS